MTSMYVRVLNMVQEYLKLAKPYIYIYYSSVKMSFQRAHSPSLGGSYSYGDWSVVGTHISSFNCFFSEWKGRKLNSRSGHYLLNHNMCWGNPYSRNFHASQSQAASPPWPKATLWAKKALKKGVIYSTQKSLFFSSMMTHHFTNIYVFFMMRI